MIWMMIITQINIHFSSISISMIFFHPINLYFSKREEWNFNLANIWTSRLSLLSSSSSPSPAHKHDIGGRCACSRGWRQLSSLERDLTGENFSFFPNLPEFDLMKCALFVHFLFSAYLLLGERAFQLSWFPSYLKSILLSFILILIASTTLWVSFYFWSKLICLAGWLGSYTGWS